MLKLIHCAAIIVLATPIQAMAQSGGFLQGLEKFAKDLEKFSKDIENASSQNQNVDSTQKQNTNQKNNSTQNKDYKDTNFKNKSGIYQSLFLDNKTSRICSLSSEEVQMRGQNRNYYAELHHNVAIVSFATNLEKYKPDNYSLPLLVKPSINHPFIKQRNTNKYWLRSDNVRPSFDEHFENHEPWANALLGDGFHQYISSDLIDKIGKGQIEAGNYKLLPNDKWRELKGCSVLVGFEEHIKQAEDGLKKYGHKFLRGKPVQISQLLTDYSEQYWNVKWETYNYARFNTYISPSSMLLLRELGLDSETELNKIATSINAGQLEKDYFSGLKDTEKKVSIDVYIRDLYTAKKEGFSLINARNDRQKVEGVYLANLKQAEDRRRAEREAADNAEAIAREKRRDALRANKTISTGISCIADQYEGAREINYIAGMYANNTNIQIITSYVTNSRICSLSRQSYAAKNFKQLNGMGQLVTLQSRNTTNDGKYIFTMINGKDWYVD